MRVSRGADDSGHVSMSPTEQADRFHVEIGLMLCRYIHSAQLPKSNRKPVSLNNQAER